MTEPAPSLVRSPLSDGQWHRMHPLTPLLRGGLAIIVVAGVIVANLRDRLIGLVLPWVDPGATEDWERWSGAGDPVDWIVANDLYLLAALAVLAVTVVLIVGFTLSWRFHTFRITGDDVEVRRGVVFRSHRRAPLDRVQGVNLTRPFVARLLGLAKLEVVGAGLDANARLEYLRTRDAETIRADILRLASGARAEVASAATPTADARSTVIGTLSRGVTGLIDGEEPAVAEAESVVRIPVPRLVASYLLDTTTIVVLLVVVGSVILASLGWPWLVFVAVPAVLGMAGYQLRQIIRTSRYAIAPTPDGLRITYGLLTSITETIPPGRIHAVEVTQPMLWRPAGWWSVRINRVNGRGASDTTTDLFTTVLPVGTRDEVHRVLALVLDGTDRGLLDVDLVERGLVASGRDADGFTTTPRRARILRPLSWRRNGFALRGEALLMRRGLVWRKLAIVPLSRLQSLAISQGPLERALGVAGVRAHTVAGPVHTGIGALGRDEVLRMWHDVARETVVAAAQDRSHRWADGIEEER